MAKSRPEPQPDEGGSHRLNLPPHNDGAAAWEFLFGGAHDPLKAFGHGAQVAALDIAININHRLDIVMAHHALFGAPRNRGQIA